MVEGERCGHDLSDARSRTGLDIEKDRFERYIPYGYMVEFQPLSSSYQLFVAREDRPLHGSGNAGRPSERGFFF
jgi:hypothetical protein